MRLLLGDAPGDEALSVYDVPRPGPGRPWVLANMVAGLDGSTAVRGRVRDLSSTADRDLFTRLRSVADVVLVGAGTVRAEGYGPVRLPDVARRERRGRGQAELPPIAVVSGSLRLDYDGALFRGDGPRPLVVTAAAAGTEAIELAERHADVLMAGEEVVHLQTALDLLEERGCAIVLTEGGPRVLSELIEADLLDELCLTLAPLVGGDPLPVAQTSLPELRRFTLASVLEADGDLFLRYLASRP